MSRILVIEDDPDLRPVLKEILTEANHQVEAVSNATDGFELLNKESYDLVLTDGRLPDGTGMQVSAEARRRGIKPLIITGYMMEMLAAELEQFEYLLKPLRSHELVAAVERAIASSKKK